MNLTEEQRTVLGHAWAEHDHAAQLLQSAKIQIARLTAVIGGAEAKAGRDEDGNPTITVPDNGSE